jgi:GH25 family lysozyme M1 (1,4-beta-N-acetylmuramidase)
MARKEAQAVLKAVKPYRLEYPIAYDFEYDSVSYASKNGVKMTKKLATSLVEAFCGEIEKNKYYAVNYANPDYLNNYFDSSLLKKYALWLAHWVSGDSPSQNCVIWQYSSKGKVNGISGEVDMNKGYVDFPSVIRKAGLNGLSEKKWYSDALEWGIANGITDGSNPEEPATRAQVIVMLKRYHDKFF